MTKKSKDIRLSKAARQLNVGTSTIVEFLDSKGVQVAENPNSKITPEQFQMLREEFEDSMAEKQEAAEMKIGNSANNVVIRSNKTGDDTEAEEEDEATQKVESHTVKTHPAAGETAVTPEEKLPKAEKEEKKEKEEAPEEPAQPEAKVEKPAKEEPKEEEKETQAKGPEKSKSDDVITGELRGLKVVGKIKLDDKKKDSGRGKKAKGKRKSKASTKETEEKTTAKKQSEKKESTKKKAAAKKTEKTKKSAAEKKKEKETEAPETSKKQVEAKADEKATEKPAEKTEEGEKVGKQEEMISSKADRLKGLKVVGKIDLPENKRRRKGEKAASDGDKDNKKRRRRRRRRKRDTTGSTDNRSTKSKDNNKRKKKGKRNEPSEQEVQSNVKATLAQMQSSGKSRQSQRRSARRERREAHAREQQRQMEREAQEATVLRVTEFVSANDLASMMDVSVNELISVCFSMGVIVTINQRLDADTITVIADEFGFDVEFTSAEEEVEIEEEEDKEEDLEERPPIVTIMGHVDHGKTTLLDYIRSAKVAAGEAGGITQHIGAYQVETESKKKVTFLDTPGHEAFTAMRARGARLTDVAIIVVAADDGVMPQTKEAINHAQVGSVPIVIAINKIDKPAANPTRVKQELAEMNVLIEEYGGDIQCQEISAKTGEGIDDLLEAVLLASEIMELKANPDKRGIGAVIEASLDKGRGYVSTMLVQAGTIKVGDVILAGSHYGKIRAMTDHFGKNIKKAGPSRPVQILGLDGAPQAGDQFNVMETDREAREIASKRKQILREQTIRATRRLTLSDIGRRKELGNFQQLNVVLKGDVDGSVEAISDALLKLSNPEVEVNIIHKGVGPVSESDVLLASTADAVIIAFQVRPSRQSRALADQENIEIRTYSIIYKVIDDVKAAIEGLLSPEIQEEIVGNVEVRETFKISKIGTIAGCYVTEGYVKRHAQVRLIREGVVVYNGKVDTLKRYKDDVTEVKRGFECGLTLENFNDVKVGDELEVFEEREVKRKLEEVRKQQERAAAEQKREKEKETQNA